MDFVIHSDLIGSKRHLSSEGAWVEEIPDDCWIVGESSFKRDLLNAMMLAGVKMEVEPPKTFAKVMNNFSVGGFTPWEMVMPGDVYQEWALGILDKVSKAYGAVDLSYYENVFKKTCEVLEALEPMKIHGKKWDYIASRDIQGVSQDVVDSFEPYEDGFVDKVKYSLTSTVTGRMTVKSGPEILRLNKELKPIIKSRYKGGKIVQFDYVSLEPRLALILAGHEVSDDIYSDINKMVFNNSLSRDVVKVSTLSVMYGAGAKSLSENVSLSLVECKNIIKQLKEFFGILLRAKKLSKEYRTNKFIRNHFGRAVYSESGAVHRLFSNFNQSSAVDCANIGFWNIVQLWKGTRVIPLFLIHDNIGLDFPPEMLTEENFQKTKDAGSKMPNLDGKLLMDHDII